MNFKKNTFDVDRFNFFLSFGSAKFQEAQIAYRLIKLLKQKQMKKILLIAAILTAFTARISAQWSLVSEDKLYTDMVSVHFPSPTTGYAVGGHGIVKKTTDGGQTWKAIDFNAFVTLTSVYFTDTLTGYVAGDLARVYKTTDGGVSWKMVSTFSCQQTHGTYFSSATNGYVIASNYNDTAKICKTSDAGLTWNKVSSGLVAELNKIYFKDVNNGFALGKKGGFVKTTDGGNSWQTINLGTTATLAGISFKGSTGFVVSATGDLYNSTDNGANWAKTLTLPLPSGTPIVDMSFASKDTGVIIGESAPGFLITTDGGNTWTTKYTMSIGNRLYKVNFASPLIGYVAGVYGIILKTTDGGQTWKLKSGNKGDCYRGICFPDSQTGYAVGELGMIRKTIDGGKTWTDQVSGIGSKLNGVYFLSPSFGYVIGQNYLLKTNNGGLKWTIVVSGLPNILNSMHFADTMNGFITCDGLVLKSTDGFKTYTTAITSSGETFGDMGFTSPMDGIVTGYAEKLYITKDGGNTWTMKSTGSIGRNWKAISFPNITTGYILGTGGEIIKTTDGGNTWNAITSPVNLPMNDIWFTSADTGFITGNGTLVDKGYLAMTHDGGDTWTELSYAPTASLHSLFFTADGTGFAGGEGRNLLMYKDMPYTNSTCPRAGIMKDYINIYMKSNVSNTELAWTGDKTTCVAGTTSLISETKTLDRINYFRTLVGLPGNVQLDAGLNSKCREAALMMDANGLLSHTPPSNWKCYTTVGADAAGFSNLNLGGHSSKAIAAYMDDDGSKNYAAGHRRWVLNSKATIMGTGSTSIANALYVIGNDGPSANVNFIAYPPNGFFPAPLLPASKRWSFGKDGAVFTNAKVEMKDHAGSNVAVTIEPLTTGMADNSIVWVPDNIDRTNPMDITYSVTVKDVLVGGILQTYSYAVTIGQPFHPPFCPSGQTYSESSCGCSFVTAVEEKKAEKSVLKVNNPFNESLETIINTDIPGDFELILTDIMGREYEKKVFTNKGEAELRISWNTGQLHNGMYLIVMKNKNRIVDVKKAVKQN
jgi:photosystem II stability/assembly factor-like uncharacterized protein/uncharacterized protein YkwD